MNRLLLFSSAVLVAGLLAAPLLADRSPELAAAGSAGPGATVWNVDPVHSTVLFRIKHLGASWAYGRFDAVIGALTLDPEKPGASSVEFAVDTASVNTNSKDRDDHLRSPDFLNAKVNPKISFRSTKVEKAGANKFTVTGTMQLGGKEKEVSFTAEHVGNGKNMQGAEIVGFEAIFTIRRSDFGVAAYPTAIGEEVQLTVSIEAIRKS